MCPFLLILTLEASTPQNGQTHSKTIRLQKPTNCLSVFDHFVGLALTGLHTLNIMCLLPTSVFTATFENDFVRFCKSNAHSLLIYVHFCKVVFNWLIFFAPSAENVVI